VDKIIEHAFGLGITSIDTSPYYYDSENTIGKALAVLNKPRESYQLSTKAGRIARNEWDYSYDWITKSVHRSLERLHTSYLDIVYCHDTEYCSVEELGEGLRALNDLKRDGYIKAVGISALPLETLLEYCKAHSGKIDVVLSYCNMTLQNTRLAKYTDAIRATGVKTIVNASPLAMGILRSQPRPTWHPAAANTALMESLERVSELCKKAGADFGQVAVAFSLEKFPGSTVIGLSSIKEVDAAHEASQANGKYDDLYTKIREELGPQLDWSWPSSSSRVR